MGSQPENNISIAYKAGKSYRDYGMPIDSKPSYSDLIRSEAFKLGWNHQDQLLRLISEAETEFKNNQAREAETKIIANQTFNKIGFKGFFPTKGSF